VLDPKDLVHSCNTSDPHVLLSFVVRNDVARGTICDPLSEWDILEEDSSTGSEAAFFLAKWWLDRCKRDHKACRDFQRIPQLPDRIIDVGPSDGSQVPRLRETNGVQRADYVTLSHRWGSNLTLTTKENTLLERMRGIPVQSMPQTFKDAVKITRKFGIRYLWIDALCILQDSKSDWEVQATEMAAIYRNSLFTIAAENATDSSGGCFANRDGYLVRPHELNPPVFGAADIFKNYIRAHVPDICLNSTLTSRGWILQEEVLSTRTLRYQKDQLSWRCCTSIASEQHPGMRSVINSDFISEFQQNILDSTPWFHSDAPSQSSFNTVWHHVLMDYSSRSLSIKTDRLAAIYGLADALRSSCRLTYVAGLWQEQLQKDLLWIRTPNSTTVETLRVARLVNAIAPSWSWASLDAPISFITNEMTMPLLEGVHIEARVSGSPSVQTGFLTIQSNVRMAYTDGKKLVAHSGDDLNEVLWYPDDPISNTWIWFIAVARSYPKYAAARQSAYAGATTGQSSVRVRRPMRWFNVHCLGIVPTMRRPREFRRVGVAIWPLEVFAPDGEDSLNDHDDVAENQDLNELQERFFRLELSENSNGRHWEEYFASVGYSYVEFANLSRRPKRTKLRII